MTDLFGPSYNYTGIWVYGSQYFIRRLVSDQVDCIRSWISVRLFVEAYDRGISSNVTGNSRNQNRLDFFFPTGDRNEPDNVCREGICEACRRFSKYPTWAVSACFGASRYCSTRFQRTGRAHQTVKMNEGEISSVSLEHRTKRETSSRIVDLKEAQHQTGERNPPGTSVAGLVCRLVFKFFMKNSRNIAIRHEQF